MSYAKFMKDIFKILFKTVIFIQKVNPFYLNSFTFNAPDKMIVPIIILQF